MVEKTNWIFSEAFYNKQQTEKELTGYTHAELVKHIHELRSQLNDVTKQLQDKKQLEYKERSVKKITVNDYKQEWSYPTKILFIIALYNKPLTSLEIHTQLKKLDAQFKHVERQQTMLSSILSRTCKRGSIGRVKLKGKNELLFTLPNWLDKKGELIEPFASSLIPFNL